MTFARAACFTKAYAKTNWSFPNEGSDGKKSEFLYWDDAAYGMMYDCPAYVTAAATQASKAAKQDDVDAFLNSIGGEATIGGTGETATQNLPAISLSLANPLYANVDTAYFAILLFYVSSLTPIQSVLPPVKCPKVRCF